MHSNQIEKDVAVTSIKHRNISIWPILKCYLVSTDKAIDTVKKADAATLKILLKNLLPDLSSLFKIKNSKYWVFTNSERRYYINESSFDRVTTGLLNYLDDYLLFENPLPKGRTKANKLQKGEHYIGMSWMYLLQFVILKLSRKPKIEEIGVLEAYLNKDLGKIKKVYHRICAGEHFYYYLIKVFKPKLIFVVCYYSNFELIKAAKRNEIPVIELQHGLVSKEHRAYNYSLEVDSMLLPDYFLSYGNFSSKIIKEGNVVAEKNILTYGCTFIEAVNEKLSISEELLALKEQFKKVICITGQLPVTDTELLAMLYAICNCMPDICFIFKPRYSEPNAEYLEKLNFKVLGHLNTYELLKYCDAHATVYSTCALESLALGTPNISIDIKGYYTKYLKSMLADNPFNFVANSKEGLISVIEEIHSQTFDREMLKDSVAPIFSEMVTSEKFQKFFKEII